MREVLENQQAVARELITIASRRGVDLGSSCNGGFFQKDGRSIFFWRNDRPPYTGPPDEPPGTLHYNMQGAVSNLPGVLRGSEDAFRGMWSEAGSLDSLDDSADLLISWLVERKEVDGLPERHVRRYVI